MPDHSLETIEQARVLHMEDGYSVRKTGNELNVAACTIIKWKQKYNWKKSSPDYPVVSLKSQLARVTKLVDTLQPELEKIDILKPSPEHKEILANYRRFSELQLKLIKQLGALQPIDRRPAKKNIFL